MKEGTFYAGRVLKAFSAMRAARGATRQPTAPTPDDPLRRLAVGVFGAVASDARAERAVDRLLKVMTDFNEIRVSNPAELRQAMGNTIPQAEELCGRLITALQSVYDRENRMSLDRLLKMGRREARTYLEELEGVDEYAAASVLLWSLGAHAIPVNDQLLAELREAELVNPEATRAEVQAFLERHVSAARAREFCLVMRSFSARRYARLAEKKGGRARGSNRKATRKSAAK